MALGDSFMGAAAGAGTVSIVIKAIDQYSKELDHAKKRVATTASSFDTSSLLIKTAAIGAATAVASAAVTFIKASVEQAAAADRATQRIKFLYGEQAGAAIEAARRIAKEGIQSANEIESAFGSIKLRFGDIFSDAERDALVRVSQDLAAASGTEFAETFNTVAMALLGSERGLKAQFGITLKDATGPLEKLVELMEQTKNLSNASEQSVNTYAGQVAILSREWNDFLQKVGKPLIEEFFNPMLHTLNTIVQQQGVLKTFFLLMKAGVAGATRDFGTFFSVVDEALGILDQQKQAVEGAAALGEAHGRLVQGTVDVQVLYDAAEAAERESTARRESKNAIAEHRDIAKEIIGLEQQLLTIEGTGTKAMMQRKALVDQIKVLSAGIKDDFKWILDEQRREIERLNDLRSRGRASTTASGRRESGIPKVDQRQSGGLVMSPTIAQLHPGEAIVPFKYASKGGMGGVTVVINGPFIGDEYAFTRRVSTLLQQEMRSKAFV